MPTSSDTLTQHTEQDALQWLLRYSPQVVLQSSVLRPSPYESIAEVDEGIYLPEGGRNYQPAAMQFTCAPNPPTVITATRLPAATNNPDAAIQAALAGIGLTANQFSHIALAPLRPLASVFGSDTLLELLRRLRWGPDFIVENGRNNTDALVPRLLLHIPGHFRELARRAPTAREAHALESLGWLLMGSLRSNVRTAININWWVPPDPAFVTPCANPLPPLSTDVQRMIVRMGFIDTTLSYADYNTRFNSWDNGLAGRHWREETSGANPGLPFYGSLLTIPAPINTTTQRQQFQQPWQARLADTDQQFPPTPGQVTLTALQNAAALRHCQNNNPHLPQGLLLPASLQGVELASDFPLRVGAPIITRLTVLGVLRPVFELAFRTISDLGWNDLLYHTDGAACFRGVKHPPHRVFQNLTQQTVNTITAAQQPAVLSAIQSARTMSNHGLGAAVDFNTFENWQDVAARPRGSMNPRIVALFEAFNFRWGACFSTTDPMHFEYLT
jgi:hypothetical protein